VADADDKWLAAARPHTTADDGFTASAAGEQALARIHRAVEQPRPAAWRRRRTRAWVGSIGLAATAAAVTAVALVGGSTPARPPSPPHQPPVRAAGPRPANMALVAYDSCTDLLAGLRAHAAANVGPYGLPGQYGGEGIAYDSAARSPTATAAGSESAPDHSTTNVQESGVDEPDIVKSDGRRIVTVTGGVLRVTDAATKQITGSLDLTSYAGAQSAQLEVAGDRALVLLDPGTIGIYDGAISRGGPVPATTDQTSTYLVVDLSAQPSVLGTFHPTGGYVDARMIGSTVRLVVESNPKIVIPYDARPNISEARRTANNRAQIEQTPLGAWLPSYEITTRGTTTKHMVACDRVSHPAEYTGGSMLTIYTIDLRKDLEDTAPVSLAADGDTVYATAGSLYLASNPNWWSCNGPCPSRSTAEQTEIHRFDISTDSRPTYLGSGNVPGRLLSQYSLSDYDGYLRVATTTGQWTAKTASGVYILDANTLKLTGHVDGLGKGEQIYAVRFAGPLGYVVTFRQTDPLYVLDLRNPRAPTAAGELTLSGYSDYLHPVGSGRLVGVGQEASAEGRVAGLQVSLFDVTKPAAPRRLARVVRNDTPGEQRLDPHAFLYWPAARLLVVPIQSWQSSESGKALVLTVDGTTLNAVGTITNPSVGGSSDPGLGIQRSLVIGDDIWTLSDAGLKVSDMATLASQSWIPFS
jgi:hypothetical protein